MIDWNIQARAHACQACQKPFADKQPFHTLLFDERQGYHRLDVCEDCWKAQFSQGAVDKKGFISHWQSVYTPPPATAPDPIQKDTAETLLRKLVEQNVPEHAGARYILAVMLERKRILKVKTKVVENGSRIFIYEHGKSGDLFSIPDPKLELNHLEQVQKDVAHLLEHGLNAGGEAVQNAPAPAEQAREDARPPSEGEPHVVPPLGGSEPIAASDESQKAEQSGKGMEPAQANGV